MDNKSKFIEQFDLPQHGFSKPVPFVDGFGFSTSKDRNQNGYPFTSIYKFFIRKEDLRKEDKWKLITIAVDYGERLKDGTIRLAPTSIKRKGNWPIELISTNEFFFDPQSTKFLYKKKTISGDQIIKRIESLHIKPTRFWTGIRLRGKLFFWREFVTNLFKIIYHLLIIFLYIISGTKTKKSIWLVTTKKDRFKEEEKVEKESFAEEKINIFGYFASAWSVVAYAIIHLIFYTLWYFYLNNENIFIGNIFTNGFLTIVYVIPSLVIFERLIPKLVKLSINYSGELFHITSFRKVKI